MAADWNVVTFVGGPLDGVCWPCVLRPDVLAVRCDDGRVRLYECDRVDTRDDGTHSYRMAPAAVPEDAWEELLGGVEPPGRPAPPPAAATEFVRAGLERLVRVAYEAGELTTTEAAKYLGEDVVDFRARGWEQGPGLEALREVDALRAEVARLRGGGGAV